MLQHDLADVAGAFVPGGIFRLAPGGHGVLSGSTFALKDLIDIGDHKTGGGNPDWLRATTPAMCHAPVVEPLLAAGAACAGKTITDELAFSLEGRNGRFYGTTLGLTAIAGHAGAPQLQIGGSPLSLLGRRGADRSLLDLAVDFSRGVRFDGR